MGALSQIPDLVAICSGEPFRRPSPNVWLTGDHVVARATNPRGLIQVRSQGDLDCQVNPGYAPPSRTNILTRQIACLSAAKERGESAGQSGPDALAEFFRRYLALLCHSRVSPVPMPREADTPLRDALQKYVQLQPVYAVHTKVINALFKCVAKTTGFAAHAAAFFS
jgi:hypothetical protein